MHSTLIKRTIGVSAEDANYGASIFKVNQPRRMPPTATPKRNPTFERNNHLISPSTRYTRRGLLESCASFGATMRPEHPIGAEATSSYQR